jgi:hypothetical protein
MPCFTAESTSNFLRASLRCLGSGTAESLVPVNFVPDYCVLREMGNEKHNQIREDKTNKESIRL